MGKAFNYRLRADTAPISVEGYRQAARRALPRMVWEYVDGGAEGLVTLRDNVAAFERQRLVQRVLTGVAIPSLATTVAGEALSMPVMLAPTGLCGLSHWSGDVAAARAADAAGTRHVLSTASGYSIEEVAAASAPNPWYQLYPSGPKALVASLLQRAADAGYRTLVVTVDVPVAGLRESAALAGMGQPPTLTPRRALDAALRPRWWFNLMRHQRFALANFATDKLTGAAAAASSAEAHARILQRDLNWADLTWMREQWRGPLFIKGVLHPDDASRAVDEVGVEGVVVSNHGGRQLDGALATLDALPAIVERVGHRAEVLIDGGVRRGGDVIKALALGAKAVMIGRPYVYGLAADGQRGVAGVLELFRREMERTMILMGCADVKDLDRSWLA